MGRNVRTARRAGVKAKKASIAAGIGSLFTPKQAGNIAVDEFRAKRRAKKGKSPKTAKPPKVAKAATAGTTTGRRPKASTATATSRPVAGTFGRSSKKAATTPASTTRKAKTRRGFGKR